MAALVGQGRAPFDEERTAGFEHAGFNVVESREALPVRARDLAAFLKLRLLTVVLLAIATTISF